MRKRSKQNLSHYRMVTAKMGELFPVSCVPVLPGDTIQHNTSALVRVSPLNTPVMHPVRVRLHHFFVPNRIVWPESENGGWEQFITGGPDGANAASPPQITIDDTPKSIAAYLGAQAATGTVNINAMPIRAVNRIVNEYYLDQDLQTPRTENDNSVPSIAWEKDYFTTARPFSQKGPSVSIPVVGNDVDVHARADVGGIVGAFSDGAGDYHRLNTAASDLQVDAASLPDGTGSLYIPQENFLALDVNDMRMSFAVQRYQEARARYGSRFTEYLRYLGITPSDARLQRPEFLGGGATRLNFSEVLQTTPGEEGEAGVGDLYGHGIAGVRSNAYRKFFEEHGYVITMMSVRPKALYTTSMHREFRKSNKEDWYQRELVNLGQQEIWEGEIFASNSKDAFGYQDRYDEYRSHPSLVSQDFKTTLNSWHLGREFSTAPTLNGDFVKCDPSGRIYQVTEGDPLWIMVNHKMVARRLLPKRSNPRIL